MWDGGPGEHPDEGTIHAWLDGALDAESAARVEAHVRGCAACAALTAEARGLIAGASRVVAALDDVPAGARPAWAQSEVGGSNVEPAPGSDVVRADRSVWRRLRVTPARAAIAATIIVAAGLTLTHERAAKESVVTLPAGHSELRSGEGGGQIASVPAAEQPRKDAALDSAVAKNLSIAQGKPSIEASRSPAIPQAPAAGTTPVESAPLAMAEERVAAGRAAIQALRDTTAPAPDKVRVGREVAGAVAARAADEVAASAPTRKDASGAPAAGYAVARMAQGYADAGARACYSLESTQSGAMWGEQPLPLVVVVDSGPPVGPRNATLRSAATGVEVRAAWNRSGKDSVVITLERVGLAGTIALGPGAAVRAGIASSGGIASSSTASARAGSAARARAKSAASAPAPAVVPGTSAERVVNAASLPVTLRPTACPAR
jgi:hypothetical protein